MGGRGASSSVGGLNGFKELKSLNSDNLKVGDRIKAKETRYDFSNNKTGESIYDLEVVRDNKDTFSVYNRTLNTEYRVSKNTSLGKINYGKSTQYYKKKR